MAEISHQQALALLRENTRRYTLKAIGWAEWDREVERILDLRYPSAKVPQPWLVGARAMPGLAMSTSTRPDTLPRAADLPRAARRGLATAPDAP